MLGRQQDRFAAALVDRDRPIPEGVTSWSTPKPVRRFGVYRNNVSSALIEAVAIRYPVVRRLVGEEFFRAMTREYVLKHLPRSPVLIHYGGHYPEFVADFPPARALGYLADVARLESAHWEAYHGADGEGLDGTAFAAIPPDRLDQARFAFLPAVRIVASRHPIVSIWNTNTHDAEVQPVPMDRCEDALVSRPGLEVEIRRLPNGAAAFLSRLMKGDTLAEVASAAQCEQEDFDLAANLRGLVETRIVARIWFA